MTTTKIHCKPKLKAALQPTKPNLFEWWLFRYVRYFALANDSSISFWYTFFWLFRVFANIFADIHAKKFDYEILLFTSGKERKKYANHSISLWQPKFIPSAFVVAKSFSINFEHVFQVSNLRAINFEIQRRYKIKCCRCFRRFLNWIGECLMAI